MAVLVVVEHGDVALLLQLPLDLKAAGGGDVLQIDATEGAGDVVDSLDKLVHVLGLDAQREGVHPAEGLEQHALALHHRHPGLRADVPKPQHGGAVGDNGHQVMAAGEGIALRRVLLDLQAGLGHAGGIGQGQGLLVVGGHGGHHLDLSLPLPVQPERFLRVIHGYVPRFPVCPWGRVFLFIIPASRKIATQQADFFAVRRQKIDTDRRWRPASVTRRAAVFTACPPRPGPEERPNQRGARPPEELKPQGAPGRPPAGRGPGRRSPAGTGSPATAPW